MIDWTELLTSDGPVALGVGGILGAIAYRIRTHRRERRQAEMFAGRVTPEQRRVRQIEAVLQRCAVSVGADAALLLWWEPTSIGGTVSAVAEWPGLMDSLGDMYDQLEQGPSYRRDVIDGLREHRWCSVRTRDLTPSSTLSDLCAARGIALTWHRYILEDDGAVLYVALSYRADTVDNEDVRHALRRVSTQLAELMR